MSQTKSTEVLQHCPFCSELAVHFEKEAGQPLVVRCFKCGASGPPAHNEGAARQRWNARRGAWRNLALDPPLKESHICAVAFTDGTDTYAGHAGRNGFGDISFYGYSPTGAYREHNHLIITRDKAELRPHPDYPITHWLYVPGMMTLEDVV